MHGGIRDLFLEKKIFLMMLVFLGIKSQINQTKQKQSQKQNQGRWESSDLYRIGVGYSQNDWECFSLDNLFSIIEVTNPQCF